MNYKKYQLYLFAFLVLFATACSVSRQMEKPVPDLPVQFRNGSVTDSSSIADMPWKTFFTDPSLQALIDTAIARNFDVQLSLKNLESAQLLLNQSKFAGLPSVSLQTGATLNRPSDNSLNGISLSQFLGKSYLEDYQTSAGVSWEADIWGKIRNQKTIAQSQYLQTDEVRKAVQTGLVSAVANAYYNLLMLDAQLAVAKKNVLLSDSTLQIVQLQYRAGQVTELAVQQTNAQRLVAAQLIPKLEQAITVQENALSILTGKLPSAINRVNSLQTVSFPETVSAGFPSALVARRPDVREKEIALTVANAQSNIARANMYPAISITAAGGVNAFKASNWFSVPASLFGTVAGGITAPLFNGKRLKTAYELSKVDQEKTVILFRQAVLKAVGEVSDALVSIEKLKEQQSVVDARLAVLQKAVVNAGLLFQNGMATYLEVINAQGNILESELEADAIKRAQLGANVELYRALGGGWK
jgi:NodT family efflux transporter outer membrane factor (OMF) lipoprotein